MSEDKHRNLIVTKKDPTGGMKFLQSLSDNIPFDGEVTGRGHYKFKFSLRDLLIHWPEWLKTEKVQDSHGNLVGFTDMVSHDKKVKARSVKSEDWDGYWLTWTITSPRDVPNQGNIKVPFSPIGPKRLRDILKEIGLWDYSLDPDPDYEDDLNGRSW